VLQRRAREQDSKQLQTRRGRELLQDGFPDALSPEVVEAGEMAVKVAHRIEKRRCERRHILLDRHLGYGLKKYERAKSERQVDVRSGTDRCHGTRGPLAGYLDVHTSPSDYFRSGKPGAS
jgi:hypothetical protein